MKTRPNNNQMWSGFIGTSDAIYQSCCSAVFHCHQVHSTHSAMTRFQHILKSSWFWRSLVDSSCPNHQTPCWGTEERYKHPETHETVNIQLTCTRFQIVNLTIHKCSTFSIRLLIHSLKWRSSDCQSTAARNRHELLTTTVRCTQWLLLLRFWITETFLSHSGRLDKLNCTGGVQIYSIWTFFQSWCNNI